MLQVVKFSTFSILAIALCVPEALGSGDNFAIESSEERASLIELYSSEGCSSCPPADAWLRTLRREPLLWKKFVPMEFHIDYWNGLGWQDPFAKPDYSRRQNEYANSFGSSQVYTPEFILNGAEWKSGMWGGRTIPSQRGERVGVLSVLRTGRESYGVTFRPQGISGDLTVYGAILGNGFVSHVTRGENRGEALRHEFVVLNLKSQPLKRVPNGFTTDLNLSIPKEIKADSYSLAVWVTKTGELRPLQAVGGDLK